MFGIIFPFEALVILLFRQIYHLRTGGLPRGRDPAPGGVAHGAVRAQALLRSDPRDFREAAILDGAREWQVLLRVYLPLSRNIIYAMAIITFMGPGTTSSGRSWW